MSPIRPEQKALYPDDWDEIRFAILVRAGNRCEWCLKPNGVTLAASDAAWFESARVWGARAAGAPVEVPGLLGTWRGPKGERVEAPAGPVKRVRVVLTIAHLDHDPTNNRYDNLRALCQRCHLGYDVDLHKKNAAATRARKAGEGDALGARGTRPPRGEGVPWS